MANPGTGLTIIAICLPFLGKTVWAGKVQPGQAATKNNFIRNP
jgi:hypothetical protein